MIRNKKEEELPRTGGEEATAKSKRCIILSGGVTPFMP
jgi:hypothetical protein